MKVSRLIKRLEVLHNKYGDIEVILPKVIHRNGEGFVTVNESKILVEVSAPKTNPTIRLY